VKPDTAGQICAIRAEKGLKAFIAQRRFSGARALRLSTVIVFAIGACGGEEARPARVRDGFLHDAENRTLILRGVNLSGAQKTAPYLDDKTQADYTRLRSEWGFNAVRFLMTWSAVEPAPGVYNDVYLDGVAERMAWAQQAGLYVVLDMHQDIYGEGFGFDGAPKWTCDQARYDAFVPRDPWFANAADPNVVACIDGFYERADLQASFVAMWRRVAERLHDQPAIIGFDVLNEPNWGSYPVGEFETDRLAPMYTRVVESVREVAPAWVAFLEPSASRNLGFASKLPAFDFPDVMYSPHSYDAMAEAGAGFDPSRRQPILDGVAELATEARALDAGLWIGEYGGNADHAGIVEYMTAQYDAAGAVAAGTMYWAYDKSDGYALLDPSGAEKPVLLGAVVRPYPTHVAGTPTSYAFDPATRTFTATYAPKGTGSTVIAVPPRVYPNGYDVACDGCVYETTAGELVITVQPKMSPATITLTPR
jgi:endoglycosylceramidase